MKKDSILSNALASDLLMGLETKCVAPEGTAQGEGSPSVYPVNLAALTTFSYSFSYQDHWLFPS